MRTTAIGPRRIVPGYEQKGLHTVMVTQDSGGTRSLYPGGSTPEQTKGDGTHAFRDECPITAEDVIGFDALWESMLRSASGVMWKGSVASFVLNGADNISRLSAELSDGTYKPGKNTHFRITSPKPRNVVAQCFRDRVYHRSIVDNLVYPTISPSWIYDNAACQKDKGTDFARQRFRHHLRKAYMRYGTEVWVLSVDVKGYYDNIPHAHAEAMLASYLPDWGARMAIDALRAHYPGSKGYNPGSDVVQMVGVSYLSGIDHYIKDGLRVRGYLRYMDDLRIVHGDKDVLLATRDVIGKMLGELGLKMHPKKTHIRPASHPNTFLGFDFRMLRTGKVLMTLRPESIKSMRRRIGRLAALEERGLRPTGTTDEAYRGWRAHAEKGDSRKALANCDEWYMDQIIRRLT